MKFSALLLFIFRKYDFEFSRFSEFFDFPIVFFVENIKFEKLPVGVLDELMDGPDLHNIRHYIHNLLHTSSMFHNILTISVI